MQEFFAKIKTRLLTCIEAINNFEIFKGIIVPVVKFSLAFLTYRIIYYLFYLYIYPSDSQESDGGAYT